LGGILTAGGTTNRHYRYHHQGDGCPILFLHIACKFTVFYGYNPRKRKILHANVLKKQKVGKPFVVMGTDL
jgi:hypothetical protein